MVYGFVDPGVSTLGGIREFLDKLENGILISMFCRSDYPANEELYKPDKFVVPGFRGSQFDKHFRDLLFKGQMSFKIADEVPFYNDQPPLKKKPVENVYPNGPSSINLAAELMSRYLARIDKFCRAGNDGKYQETAAADAGLLDLLSTRIHRGAVWIADCKHKMNPREFDELVGNSDNYAILMKITDSDREDQILARVYEKAKSNKVDSDFARDFFRDPIIRLTKQVQILRLYEICQSR